MQNLQHVVVTRLHFRRATSRGLDFSVPWELGIRKAKEILFPSRFLTASAAHELGFVSQVAPLLIQATLAMAFAVLLEAGLSFLSLGAQPPESSWGSMLNTSRTFLRQDPRFGIFPGIALSLLLLGHNFLADAVPGALDPHQQKLL